MRTLILRCNNVREPAFPQIEKHFNLRKRSQSWHTVAYAGFSKGGGPENLRIMKTRMKIFQPKTKSVFLPKIRRRQKKKGLHSNLVRFSAQNYVKAKKRSLPTVFVLKFSAHVTKGGAMPQFCILFYANYTILATQRGGHGPMAPPKYAPVDILYYYHSVTHSICMSFIGIWVCEVYDCRWLVKTFISKIFGFAVL